MKTKGSIGCCSWWYMRNVMSHLPHSSEPHQGAWRRKVSSRCPSQTPCSAPLCDYLPEFEVIFSALYHMYDFSYSIIVCFCSIILLTKQFRLEFLFSVAKFKPITANPQINANSTFGANSELPVICQPTLKPRYAPRPQLGPTPFPSKRMPGKTSCPTEIAHLIVERSSVSGWLFWVNWGKPTTSFEDSGLDWLMYIIQLCRCRPQ